ncbi:MAG: ribosome-associated translation inhibitor RaiA [Phycisphaerales bacterium]|nr:ribosome-associated translation inhibitor RaiA [Phycisphaerales bacterium]
MRINVTGKHVDLTPAMVQFAESKCEKITKFFDGIQQISCVLDKAPHGEFLVEIIVDVVHHEDFITKVQGPDVYAAIDDAVDKASRQLRDFKEKLRDRR